MASRRVTTALLVIGSVAVGGTVGAVIGVPALSGASENGSTTTTVPSGDQQQPFMRKGGGEIEAAAKALNLTTEQLLQKLSDGKTTIADVAKEQNVDINTVIDAMVGADRQRIEDFVNNPLPQRGGGDGPHMHFGFGGGRGFGFGMFGGGLDELSKALGVTTDELQQALRDGKSIADIAKEHNVDINKVIDDLTNAANAKIDEAQKNGTLSEDQAGKLKTDIKQHITDIVNGSLPKIGEGMFPGGHGGPGMGWRFKGGPDSGSGPESGSGASSGPAVEQSI
ncbi:MAG TPA: hypothetical protein VL856_00315 [Acidimicrobiia bacterium]|jgi:hypothetical protein|nr:hypothetical protein [Acidimicrobiia bacterium]